jgi:hypothetical protein
LDASHGRPCQDVPRTKGKIATEAAISPCRGPGMFAPKSDPQMQAVAGARPQLSEDEVAKIARKAAHERAPVRGTGTPRGDLFGCIRPREPSPVVQHGRGRLRCLA